jgi:hypothetical protein
VEETSSSKIDHPRTLKSGSMMVRARPLDPKPSRARTFPSVVERDQEEVAHSRSPKLLPAGGRNSRSSELISKTREVSLSMFQAVEIKTIRTFSYGVNIKELTKSGRLSISIKLSLRDQVSDNGPNNSVSMLRDHSISFLN